MTSSLYLPKNRRSFDDKLQRSIAECCTQADRWLRIFNEEKNVSLSFKKATLSLGKKRSKTGRRPRAPGRKIDRPPARPGMYFKTTPTRPARAEKRNGRPPTHWACVTNRPGGRPPGPVGGPERNSSRASFRSAADVYTRIPPRVIELTSKINQRGAGACSASLSERFMAAKL